MCSNLEKLHTKEFFFKLTLKNNNRLAGESNEKAAYHRLCRWFCRWCCREWCLPRWLAARWWSGRSWPRSSWCARISLPASPPHGKENKITTCHDLITLQTEDVSLVSPKYSESAKRLSHPHIASQQILCLTWIQRVSKTCVSPEYSESAKFVSHPNIASQQNTCITWIQQVSKTCVSPEYSKSAKRVLFIRI